MPLPSGTKYRYKKGTKIRLAILHGDVIEVKNMKTGDVHNVKPAKKKPTKSHKK